MLTMAGEDLDYVCKSLRLLTAGLKDTFWYRILSFTYSVPQLYLTASSQGRRLQRLNVLSKVSRLLNRIPVDLR